jgi:pimeloyl-ACP methyl ester carboxylesterase
MDLDTTPTIIDKTHHYVRTNGVTLHVVAAGPEDGPAVVLLHGFPEFWYGWRAQIPALALAGYRVLAPDMRGYNLSEKPAGIAAYQPQHLVDDIAGLIQTTGREPARLIAHDWGGAVAWWLAQSRPELVRQLIIINMPHPGEFFRHARSSREQQLKSWYVAFFQLPGLPEVLLGANRWQALAASLLRSSRQGTFSAADMEMYRQAWSRPGALTAMINYYRAATRYPATSVPNKQVQMPVQIIWGKGDAFLGHEMAEMSLAKCAGGRLQIIDEGTHWVAHEFPGRVNDTILSFFNA